MAIYIWRLRSPKLARWQVPETQPMTSRCKTAAIIYSVARRTQLVLYFSPARLYCPPSRFNRVMYVVLTWFHADMYFSMHWVKHACSPLDREEPGFGTHFWKQCSLIFCTRVERSALCHIGPAGRLELASVIPQSARAHCSWHIASEPA